MNATPPSATAGHARPMPASGLVPRRSGRAAPKALALALAVFVVAGPGRFEVAAQKFDFLEDLDEKRVELLLKSARELAKNPEALGKNPEALELVTKPLLENSESTLKFLRKGLRSKNEKEQIGSAFLALVLKAVVENGDVSPDDAIPDVGDEARATFEKNWPEREFTKVITRPPEDAELAEAHEKLVSFYDNIDLLVATIASSK